MTTASSDEDQFRQIVATYNNSDVVRDNLASIAQERAEIYISIDRYTGYLDTLLWYQPERKIARKFIKYLNDQLSDLNQAEQAIIKGYFKNCDRQAVEQFRTSPNV